MSEQNVSLYEHFAHNVAFTVIPWKVVVVANVAMLPHKNIFSILSWLMPLEKQPFDSSPIFAFNMLG